MIDTKCPHCGDYGTHQVTRDSGSSLTVVCNGCQNTFTVST